MKKILFSEEMEHKSHKNFKISPLRIKIQTRKNEFGSEIVVEDGGVDFLNSEEIFKENSALVNIRQRLKITCGGNLEIRAREGGGVIVRIFVLFEE